MIIRAVIFDCDGPIIDSYGEDKSNFREVARRRGLKMPDDFDHRNYWGKDAASIIRELWPGEDIEEFHRLWEDLDKESLELVIPTTKDMLNRLGQHRLVFGILTQRRRRGLMPLLERHGIVDCFHPLLIQTSDRWPHLKPDPRAFDYLISEAEQLGINETELLYVGDTKADFQCARGAGIRFLGVQTGPMNRQQWLEAGLEAEYIVPDIGWLSWWLLRYARIFSKDC